MALTGPFLTQALAAIACGSSASSSAVGSESSSSSPSAASCCATSTVFKITTSGIAPGNAESCAGWNSAFVLNWTAGAPYDHWTTGLLAGQLVECVAGGYGGGVTVNFFCDSAVPGSLYVEFICDGAARATYIRALTEGFDCSSTGCTTLRRLAQDSCCNFPNTIELCVGVIAPP